MFDHHSTSSLKQKRSDNVSFNYELVNSGTIDEYCKFAFEDIRHFEYLQIRLTQSIDDAILIRKPVARASLDDDGTILVIARDETDYPTIGYIINPDGTFTHWKVSPGTNVF